MSRPTGDKPQSKLWYNDGVWWGILFNRSTEKFQVYRYDWATHSWSDTGTVVDDRNDSRADALWDGTHLYVVSAGPYSTSKSSSARVLRYSYDGATKRYSLDAGFPVTVSNGGMEAAVLAKDTTGKLWVTYTQQGRVYVNRTLDSDLRWGTPFALPAEGANAASDDLSSIIAFDDQIGVMWSNQVDDAFYFATHNDSDSDSSAWQVSTALQGAGIADDHINLKADSNGRVYAAVKTSLDVVKNPDPNAPLNLLLVRDRDGSWTNHVFGRVSDNHSRPIVLLDEKNRGVYMFATNPCCNGGKILYKQASMDNVTFPEGLGVPFAQTTTDLNLDDVTSTKQNLDDSMGLLVEASDKISGYYVNNRSGLGSVDTTAPAVQAPQQVFTASSTLGTSAVPVDLAWSASDPQSGVVQYELQQSTNGGAYAKVTLPSPTSTSMSRSLTPGSTYRFRVRAMDAAGNWSGWSEGAEFGLGAHQESSGAISYAGTWTQEASSAAYGGASKYATAAGSRASFTFTGTSVGWVTTQGPDRGKAEVWVDGVKIKTQDLYLSSEKTRKMAYVQNWAQPGTHTIEIRALGTKNASSSSARVDLDAFTFF